MDERVRAMSYNVRFDTADDEEFGWDRRKDAVASTIRFHAPLVLGLQEPLPHQFRDLRERLPAFEWVGKSRREAAGEGEYVPVGYRADRFECVDHGTFWLSETPDVPGSKGWDASWPRIVTWARLRDRRTDARLVYLNTHFDHRGPRARRESAHLLLDRLHSIRGDAPVLVAGDFNATPEDDAYRILAGCTDRETPLVDARTASEWPHHGPATTRTTYRALDPGRRIDHAFVDGLAVHQHGYATDQFGDGWYPSDHLPLVVEFEL